MPVEVNSFLYEGPLERVVRSTARGDGSHLFVSSGRKLGKTTFLNHLLDAFLECPGVRWIEGGSPSAQEDFLRWSDAPYGVLFIDDIDLFGPQAQHVLKDLVSAKGDWRLIVSFHDSAAIEGSQWSSLPSQGVEHLRLDPWEGEWQEVVKAAMRRTALTSPPDDRFRVGPMPVTETEVVNAWQEIILEVTGGHPALVGASCEIFATLASREGDSCLKPVELKLLHPDECSTDWRNILRTYIEDYLVEKELPLFDQTLRVLRDRPKVFEQLVDLARKGEPIENPFVRKQLRGTGLVYADRETGSLVVVSPLIKQWILHSADESARCSTQDTTAAARLQIVGGSPYDGLVRCEIPTGRTREIPIHGTPWRILLCLAKAKSQPVSLDQLVQDGNLSSQTAVRSAIQRLQALFRERGLTNVVDNVRGRGYRLASFPSFLFSPDDFS